MLKEALVVLLGYLIGSISPGYFFGKLVKGFDVRGNGTRKNTGATNTFKTVGKLWGVLAAFIDVLKGVPAMWLGFYWGLPEAVVYLAGIAAIIGHNAPFYLNFRGGQGVATSGGVALAGLYFYNSPLTYALIFVLGYRAIAVSGNMRKWVMRRLSL